MLSEKRIRYITDTAARFKQNGDNIQALLDERQELANTISELTRQNTHLQSQQNWVKSQDPRKAEQLYQALHKFIAVLPAAAYNPTMGEPPSADAFAIIAGAARDIANLYPGNTTSRQAWGSVADSYQLESARRTPVSR